MKRVRAAYRTPIARSCYPGTSTRRTDHARGLDRRARASKSEDRAGPRPTQTSGLPGGFDRCSGATRREALALPLVPRRGRASGDGVGRGEGPTDGPRGVFRASRAAGRAMRIFLGKFYQLSVNPKIQKSSIFKSTSQKFQGFIIKIFVRECYDLPGFLDYWIIGLLLT